MGVDSGGYGGSVGGVICSLARWELEFFIFHQSKAKD